MPSIFKSSELTEFTSVHPQAVKKKEIKMVINIKSGIGIFKQDIYNCKKINSFLIKALWRQSAFFVSQKANPNCGSLFFLDFFPTTATGSLSIGGVDAGSVASTVGGSVTIVGTGSSRISGSGGSTTT